MANKNIEEYFPNQVLVIKGKYAGTSGPQDRINLISRRTEGKVLKIKIEYCLTSSKRSKNQFAVMIGALAVKSYHLAVNKRWIMMHHGKYVCMQ